MASVRFNRGLLDARMDNPVDAIAFLAYDQTEQTNNDYGYLYLGSNLVATKYLNQMDVSQMVAGGGLLEIGDSSGSPFLTYRGLITSTSQSYDWNGNVNLPTAKVVADYVTKYVGANDTYHGSGGWGSSSDWNTYTAKYYKGGSEVSQGTSGYQYLEFTIPVANTSASGYNYSTDNSHLTTPKQVSDFFGSLAGGMRYRGAIVAATGTSTDSKCGDVYIANHSFTVTQSSLPIPLVPPITVEENDMVILNEYYVTDPRNPTPLEYVNVAPSGSPEEYKANFDVFERNLDNAVSKSSDLTQYGVAYATGTSTIASTAAGSVGSILIGQGIAAPTWLSKGTEGQILKTGKNTLDWTNHMFDLVSLKNNTDDTIRVSHYVNDSTTSTDIQIKSSLVKQTATTANEDRPVMVTASASPTSDAAAAINYETSVKINPSSGTVKSNNIILSGSAGIDNLDVYATLTWQTITAS